MEKVKTREELEEIAGFMSDEIHSSEKIISRYTRIASDKLIFFEGKDSIHNYVESTLNKEMMDRQTYTSTSIDDIRADNFKEVAVSRDLMTHRFNFHQKGIPLPTEQLTFYESLPDQIAYFDEELRQFTKEHKNTRIARSFEVQQKIIANSHGGISIQSIPFFDISYSHGYDPIPTNRNICAVCTSDEDIKRFSDLIQYIADPSPEKRIKNSETFSQAFKALHDIAPLRYGSLEDAGIPRKQLYDVLIMTGVPIHEIFGHHFEEPIRYLDFGEVNTFSYDQDIVHEKMQLIDNPHQKIADFNVRGFTRFDAYGRRRPARTHIKDGKVVEFLGSEYSDPDLKSYMNLENGFIGNASQHNDNMFPQPRMSCTVLDGETENVDLEGKIVIVPHSGTTNASNKNYQVQATEAYIIQDGEPRRMIPLQVTGGINQALANITLLPDISYHTGVCSKPEPIYYPQSRGVAQVPVSQFTRSQLWKDQQVYPLPIQQHHLDVL